MLARALGWLGRLAVDRPWAMLLATTLPALVAASLMVRVPFDLSFTGILDREDPRVQAYYALADELNFSGRMPLLLEGPEDVLDEAVAASVALEEMPQIDRVLAEPPEDWFRENAPYLVEGDIFDDWLRAATTGSAPETRPEELVEQPTGSRLVLVLLRDDPVDANLGEVGFYTIQDRADELMEPFGVTAGFAGVAAVSDQDQQRTLGRVRILTPISLVLVLGMLAVVERRPLYLLSVAFPMVLASGATLGIVGTLTGTITFMETFYGVMIFGLGVDFALHLMVRLREQYAAHGDFALAVEQAWQRSGPGVVVGGLTTAGAFAIVGMADDPTARHLGLSGSVGLGLCLLLMLTWLPAAWSLLGGAAAKPRPPLHVPGLRGLARLSAGSPVATLVVAAGVMAVAAAGFPRFHYETDLQKVFSRDVPALDVAARIQELYGVNPGPWVLRADSLEQAREWAAEIEAGPLFSRVDSLARLFPPAEEMVRRRELLAGSVEVIERQKGRQHSLLFMAGPKTEQLHQFIRFLHMMVTAGTAGPPSVDTLHPWLAEQFLGPDGRLVMFAYATLPNLDGAQARLEREELQKLDPGAAGIGITVEVTMEGDRPWLIPVWSGIVLYVVLLLGWDLRSPRRMLAAMAPVVFGVVVTVGVLCWFGPGFNVMTLVVVPLIVGLGVDDGVHVVHRIREEPDLPAYEAAVRVGQAIVMTTATTCSSFLLLLVYSGHVGLEGMARVLLVGLPLCLLCSITVVPALMSIRR